MTGDTISRNDRPLTFCPPKFAGRAKVERFELDQTRVWVLNGYWYPRLTVLLEASPNSNFRIRDGVVGRERSVSRAHYTSRPGATADRDAFS